MTIVYILAAILIFGVLIAVHEFGHFAAAKLCGVRVNEFSIGMGPLIWYRDTGETQYSLRLLPIGGFCAMEGEDEASADERSLGRQGFFKKLVIFAAGSLMNFLAGFLIILAVYSGAAGFLIPAAAGAAPEFEARNGQTIQTGDIFYEINGERVYLYSDVSLLIGLQNLPPAQPDTADARRLQTLLQRVEDDCAAPFSVAVAAALCGCSASHFMRWFKKMTGTTFTAYLNERRLATAAELLRTTDDTVLTIAGQVGFDNLSNFNRQFKARFGMTPRQYRAAG